MPAPSKANAAPPVEAPRAHSLAARVSGVALLVFMAVGLVSTVVAVATQRLDLAPHALTRAAFLDGASMRDMASALADAPMARIAASTERQASWVAAGDLGPQVRQGCTGWLFLAEELTPQPDADQHLADRAKAVAAIRYSLRQLGITLVVAVVPDKSRIETDHLCDLQRPQVLDKRLATWADLLAAEHVPLVDTSIALRHLQDVGESPFLRTDTHWTEEGADASARMVADAVRGLGVELVPHQDYDVQHGKPVRRPGDLVRLAGIEGLPLHLQPTPEDAVSSTFTPRKADSGKPGSAEDDLFGDAELPRAALIGTSFSRNSHFGEYLAAALQTPVGNFAKDGGNFWGSAGAYFSSDAFRQTPPTLVIWEIPERALQLPEGHERWIVP